MSSKKAKLKSTYGIHHFINGVWTISIIDDFVYIYTKLRNTSLYHANLFILFIAFLCIVLTSMLGYNNEQEYMMIFSYVSLTVSNLVSLLIGVYTSILLMPTQLTLLVRISIIAAMLIIYIGGSYYISKRTTPHYHHKRTFSLLEATVVGLTGLSILEELMFVLQNSQFLLLPLYLPLHYSISIASLFIVHCALCVCLRFKYNATFRESFFKYDIPTFCFYCLESIIIALTLISVLVTIWFNFLLLPLQSPLVGFGLSVIATLICSFIYYKSECAYQSISSQYLNNPLPSNNFNPGLERTQNDLLSDKTKSAIEGPNSTLCNSM